MNSIPGTNPISIPGADSIDNPDYLTTVWNEVRNQYDDTVDTSSPRAVSTPLPVPLANSLGQYGRGGASNKWTGNQTDSYTLEQESLSSVGDLGGIVSTALVELYDNSASNQGPEPKFPTNKNQKYTDKEWGILQDAIDQLHQAKGALRGRLPYRRPGGRPDAEEELEDARDRISDVKDGKYRNQVKSDIYSNTKSNAQAEPPTIKH